MTRTLDNFAELGAELGADRRDGSQAGGRRRGSERRSEARPVRWPGREALIAWGMAPCGHGRCEILVNPALVRYCKRHDRERR